MRTDVGELSHRKCVKRKMIFKKKKTAQTVGDGDGGQTRARAQKSELYDFWDTREPANSQDATVRAVCILLRVRDRERI